tara:strand:- start:419 stop:673 length:255 start_codon:yes stop_codon:yes gene_type:complete
MDKLNVRKFVSKVTLSRCNNLLITSLKKDTSKIYRNAKIRVKEFSITFDLLENDSNSLRANNLNKKNFWNNSSKGCFLMRQQKL